MYEHIFTVTFDKFSVGDVEKVDDKCIFKLQRKDEAIYFFKAENLLEKKGWLIDIQSAVAKFNRQRFVMEDFKHLKCELNTSTNKQTKNTQFFPKTLLASNMLACEQYVDLGAIC